ncbi:MAG: hypothetical protein P1V19_05105, partial [Gimesia sp.]|nr:hypothetical protein [Gimesia sp.]
PVSKGGPVKSESSRGFASGFGSNWDPRLLTSNSKGNRSGESKNTGTTYVVYRYSNYWAYQIASMGRDWQKARSAKMKFDAELKRVRAQYWRAYPNGAGIKDLQQQYERLLFDKDLSFFLTDLIEGPDGSISGLVKIAGVQAESGIAPIARNAFRRWVIAVREKMGATFHGGRGADGRFRRGQLVNLSLPQFLKAIKETADLADQYKLLRDWQEFYNAGHEKDFYPTPASYVVFVLQTNDEPISHEQAVSKYHQLARILEKSTLDKAADQQRLLPKTNDGFLKGSKGKMKLMYELMKQVSQEGDAGFLLTHFQMLARTEDRWAEAFSDYQEMVEVIGAETALKAARQARETPNGSLALFLKIIRQQSDKNCFLAVVARLNGIQWKAAQKQFDALCEIYGRDTVLKIANRVRMAPILPAARSKPGSVRIETEYISIPKELQDDPRLKKFKSVRHDEALFGLLKRSPRKKELFGSDKSGPEVKLSDANRLPLGKISPTYTFGDIAIDRGRVAIGIGSPKSQSGSGIFGNFFGASQLPSRVLIFEESENKNPLEILAPKSSQSFGSVMDLTENYLVVGDRRAWVANPRSTRKGGRIGAGSAYVYDSQTGKLLTTLNPPEGSIMQYLNFGSAVATSDEYVVIGAPGRMIHSQECGEVHIYQMKDGKHQFRFTLRDKGTTSRRFGNSIDTDGKTLIVAAPGIYQDASAQHPAAFLYNIKDGTLIARLEPPRDSTDPNGTTNFGVSVAVSGRWAAVGAMRFGKGGAVCVYEVSTGKLHAVLQTNQSEQSWGEYGHGQFVSLIVPSGLRDVWLGRSVSVSDNTIVAGSNNSVHLFDVKSARHMKRIFGPKTADSKRDEVVVVDFDGQNAAVAVNLGTKPMSWSNHLINLEKPLMQLRQHLKESNK